MRKTPFTFLAKAQNAHTQKTGDAVIYTHNGTPLPTQYVTVQSGDFLGREGDEFVNHMSFLNVVLPSKPKATDSIEYDGETWDVDEDKPAGKFTKKVKKEIDGEMVEVDEVVTMYDLSCVVKRTNPTSRTQYTRRGGR